MEVIRMGFLVSFTGNITFPKAENIRSIAKEIPLEKVMIETDCPFLAPQAMRGQRNEPAYVVRVAERIAEVKQVPLEEVARITSQNARDLFKI